MAARNAANVLPDPVGAATNTCWPAASAGHAWICASVGASKVRENHAATAGWNELSTLMTFSRSWSHFRRFGYCYYIQAKRVFNPPSTGAPVSSLERAPDMLLRRGRTPIRPNEGARA